MEFIVFLILIFLLGVIASAFLPKTSSTTTQESPTFSKEDLCSIRGDVGEQIIYDTLVKKYGVPKNQILRNVYIPTKNGKTTEIDILVVSRRGLMIFECKNFSGTVYGDAKRKNWLYYLGNKKYYFYNPFLQNRAHEKNLRNYLKEFVALPIIPMVIPTAKGNWKVSNCGPSDCILGYTHELGDILEVLPDSEVMIKNFKQIMALLEPLANNVPREKHVEYVKTIQELNSRNWY